MERQKKENNQKVDATTSGRKLSYRLIVEYKTCLIDLETEYPVSD